jgi:hypothetical protein
MQTSYSSSRILLPVRPWFIGFSLVLALLLNFCRHRSGLECRIGWRW